MKFRYLMVNDYGDVYGSNDPAVARSTWDTGDYIVVDVERGMTYEEGEDTSLEMHPVEELQVEPSESDDDEGEEVLA